MRIVLTVIRGPHRGRRFEFDQHDNFIVGRAKFARFQLSTKDGYISRVHFLVEVNPPECRLTDMGSTNGTLVNRKRVRSIDLKDGDLIGVGKETVIRVSLDALDASHENGSVPATIPPSAPASKAREPAPAAVASSFGLSDPSPTTPTAPSSGVLPAATATFHPGRACPSCGVAMERVPEAPQESPDSILAGLCQSCLAQAGSLPQPIPGIRLLRVLGRGGMGVVYLAVREADRSLAAVKTIRPAIAGSPVQIERFLREARILEQLDHPHIVAFRSMDEANGLLYFAMDYVRGTDASTLQKTLGGLLPIARALKLTRQMLDGLAYAHARGFVHRDIKPANLMVEMKDGREVARLTDFGLARKYQASQMSGLTLGGEIGGTMAFMPPEQITDFRKVEPPADQYSAAASLYRLLTGHYIYDLPRRLEEQIPIVLQDNPVPILNRRPDLPPKLAAAIHRGLARDPSKRFADIGAFAAALAPFQA